MSSLSVRQEVLQLILSPLATAGRTLTQALAFATIRQLAKVQTPEFKISFDRWLVVAKENLKWNDYCIQLFWDALQTCVRSSRLDAGMDCDDLELMDIEHLALFLVLHVPETGASKLPSPSITSTFESVWPSAEADIAQPVALALSPRSPTSPRKHFGFPAGPSSPKQV
jgi:hypothetical protein